MKKKLITLTLFISSHVRAEVNMKDASYYKNWLDLKSPAQNSLQVRRSYNSRSLHDGIFGFGWCSEFEKHLDLRDPTRILLHDCQRNSPLAFTPASGGLYRAASPNPEQLRRDSGLFVHQSSHQATEYYNQKGELVALQAGPRQKLSLFYAQGRLVKVLTRGQGELNFLWNDYGKVRRVQMGTRYSEYAYLGHDLHEVRLQGKFFALYHYDRFHNLRDFRLGDGTQERISYDEDHDWVTSIEDRHRCRQTFTYTPKLSLAKKICPGKTPQKIAYQFWHHLTISGERELTKSRLSKGARTYERTYPLTEAAPKLAARKDLTNEK